MTQKNTENSTLKDLWSDKDTAITNDRKELEHLQPDTLERLQSMLDGLIEDSDRHDAEQGKQKDILAMIRERHNEREISKLRETCETIISRHEEVSIMLDDVEAGSNLNPGEWEILFDTVAEMDLLMRRLERNLGILK